jgi:hypothetical protein
MKLLFIDTETGGKGYAKQFDARDIQAFRYISSKAYNYEKLVKHIYKAMFEE